MKPLKIFMFFLLLFSAAGFAQTNKKDVIEFKRDQLVKIKDLKGLFPDVPVACNKINGSVDGKIKGGTVSCPVNKYKLSNDIQALFRNSDLNSKIFVDISFMNCLNDKTEKRSCFIKVVE